jgi:release factor glutamine methyltransferase
VSAATLAPATVRALVAEGTRRLQQADLERPRAEASLLAGHALGLDKTALVAHPELTAGPDQTHRYDALVERRARGEPLAYLTGEREFYGRSFLVDPRALIPRPETELLVETALAEFSTGPAQVSIVDVGTGSGAIAATLALELPGARVIVSDISPEALDLARENLGRHGLGRRVPLVRGDLLGWLRGPVDLVVANLPYVPAETFDSLPRDVREYEPRLALDGGHGGARLLMRLLEQASRLEVGTLLAELDPRHADEVRVKAVSYFPDRPVDILQDLAGRERLLRVGRAG